MARTGPGQILFLGAALALGGVAAFQVAANAPAFTTALRTQSVLGDWRVPASDALYDRSAYDFHLGYGYLRSDAAFLLLGEEALPDPAVLEENAARAEALFTRSIDAAPGRVDAWTSLAWAHLLQGEVEAAEAALRVSWELAPFNMSEASERLSLVDALDATSVPGWRSDVTAEDRIDGDLRVLETYDRTYFRLLMEDAEDMLRELEALRSAP
jgi:hypothetical protein